VAFLPSADPNDTLSFTIPPVTPVRPARFHSASAPLSPTPTVPVTFFRQTSAAHFSEAIAQTAPLSIPSEASQANQDRGSVSLSSVWLWVIIACAILVVAIIVGLFFACRSRYLAEYNTTTTTSEIEITSQTPTMSELTDFVMDFANPMFESDEENAAIAFDQSADEEIATSLRDVNNGGSVE
jgi:hypothetical protein